MTDIIRVSAPRREDGGYDYTTKDIERAYKAFRARREHLQVLDSAYTTGQYDIGGQRPPYVVNYCMYISDTKSSFMAGQPPIYSCADDDPRGQEIVDLYNAQDKQAEDQRITALASRHGLAYEVCYTDVQDGRLVPRSVACSALEAFVAFDDTLDPGSVFGAIEYTRKTEDGTETELAVYDAVSVTMYRADGTDITPMSEPVPHGFTRVPITEYRNNLDYRGDFEPILSLQAALNQVLSDRIKDKNRFASAMIVAKGFYFGDSPEDVKDTLSRFRDEQAISVPQDADLSYLVKTFDEAGVQVLVDNITSEIHKFARVPDLSDQAFASNASGVAIKFKLQGLQNLASAFISQFNKGFARRCKLYDQVLGGGARIAEMAVTFRYDIPADLISQAQVLQMYTAGGLMSRQTAMAAIPLIDDVTQEKERLRSEREEDDERMRRMETDGIQHGLEDLAGEL